MWTIGSDSIGRWLTRLSTQNHVLAPSRDSAGDVRLTPLGSTPPLRSYGRLAQFPKFVLMRPGADDAGAAREQMDVILYGLRPCDAAAISILDAFHMGASPNPSYRAARKLTRLIVQACAQSDDTCFCASTRTGPVAAGGFDVQLFDLGIVYVAVAGTPEGEQLIAAGGELFAKAPPASAQRIEEFARAGRERQNIALDLDSVQQTIVQHENEPQFWQEVTPQCRMCGGCTYFCPTCTCPEAGDTSVPAPADALPMNRIGDAGRCGRRFWHKLGGSDTAAYPFRCVGCGRCMDACINCAGIVVFAHQLISLVVTPLVVRP